MNGDKELEKKSPESVALQLDNWPVTTTGQQQTPMQLRCRSYPSSCFVLVHSVPCALCLVPGRWGCVEGSLYYASVVMIM